jgi:hypothetical protein
MFVGSRQRKTLKSSKSFASLSGFWSNTYNFLNKGGWQLANPAALISTLENSQMKKTLIAMAAVAVAGAASAQVSITGAVGFGYSKDSTSKGYEVTDGNIVFSATEDLGGGLAVKASTKLDSLLGRQTANPTNADATVSVSGNGMSVTMGSFESTADARKGDVSGLSLEQGLDKSNYNLATVNVDGIVATADVAAGLSVAVSHVELTPIGDATATAKGTKVMASYTSGALMAYVSQMNYSTAGQKSTTSFAATYDLGVAKVGVGTQNKGGSATDNATIYSVKVPMGAVSFGLARATSGSAKGTAIGASYAMSKQTTVYFGRQSSTEAALDASYRVKIVKAF